MTEEQDIADEIFKKVDLLTLRKSTDYLCSVGRDDLESFSRKYSGMVIFFLNVLDEERTVILLNRLTDSSVLYLLEEELRMILIKDIASLSDPTQMLSLTEFFELIDKNESMISLENLKNNLQVIFSLSTEKKHFPYLSSFDQRRRDSIVNLMWEKNPNVALGVLFFTRGPVISEILQKISASRADIFASLPVEFLQERLYLDLDLFTDASILPLLPGGLSAKLAAFNEFRAAANHIYERMNSIFDSNQAESAKRQAIMDLILGMLQKEDPSIQSLVLADIARRNYLSKEDMKLLEVLLSGDAFTA